MDLGVAKHYPEVAIAPCSKFCNALQPMPTRPGSWYWSEPVSHMGKPGVEVRAEWLLSLRKVLARRFPPLHSYSQPLRPEMSRWENCSLRSGRDALDQESAVKGSKDSPTSRVMHENGIAHAFISHVGQSQTIHKPPQSKPPKRTRAPTNQFQIPNPAPNMLFSRFPTTSLVPQRHGNASRPTRLATYPFQPKGTEFTNRSTVAYSRIGNMGMCRAYRKASLFDVNTTMMRCACMVEPRATLEECKTRADVGYHVLQAGYAGVSG